MLLSLNLLLVLGAFIALLFTISIGKPPLWVAVLLLVLIHLLGIVPLR
jgi:uncharacterized membrane protein YoaK (UPF0700 family)